MIHRNKKLLDIAREAPCMFCSAEDGTVVAAHSNQLRDGKGRGIKAHDYRIAALCYKCHMEIDQGKTLTKEQKIDLWEKAHRKFIGWLFENKKLEILGK